MSSTIRAFLSGNKELPPITTTAVGKFSGKETELAIEFKLSIKDITGLSQAHIHLGQPDKKGAVVAFLYGPNCPSGDLNVVQIKATLTDGDLLGPLKDKSINDLLNEIKSGNAYVDVHTREYPLGEIRGQLKTSC